MDRSHSQKNLNFWVPPTNPIPHHCLGIGFENKEDVCVLQSWEGFFRGSRQRLVLVFFSYRNIWKWNVQHTHSPNGNHRLQEAKEAPQYPETLWRTLVVNDGKKEQQCPQQERVGGVLVCLRETKGDPAVTLDTSAVKNQLYERHQICHTYAVHRPQCQDHPTGPKSGWNHQLAPPYLS